MTKNELAPFVYGHSVKAMRKWFLGQLNIGSHGMWNHVQYKK